MDELTTAIATIISDYRKGEICAPDKNHVARWIDQFHPGVREPILKELAHVLKKTYFKCTWIEVFLDKLVSNQEITGADPATFWKGVRFLSIQNQGNSQHDLLSIFEKKLQEKFGLSIHDCGNLNPHTYLYIDDVIYSGGRVKSDIVQWITTSAPQEANLLLVFVGIHLLGHWFAKKDIEEALKASGKKIKLDWRAAVGVEDRKSKMEIADVLRPTKIPEQAGTQAYVKSLEAEPILRPPGQMGKLGIFSSEEGRTLLEQQFLIEGVRVRELCPNFDAYMRPLGRTLMKTTGFGSTIVTYRNCANNTPLVLWAGDPWYPLFPRKTN